MYIYSMYLHWAPCVCALVANNFQMARFESWYGPRPLLNATNHCSLSAAKQLQIQLNFAFTLSISESE